MKANWRDWLVMLTITCLLSATPFFDLKGVEKRVEFQCDYINIHRDCYEVNGTFCPDHCWSGSGFPLCWWEPE